MASFTPKDFFEQKFARKLGADPACLAESGVKDKNVAVDIDGPTGGQWTFQFDPQGHVQMHTGIVSAACTIQTSDKVFEGMMMGSVNVPMAFLTRKIKVKGETSLAVKLGLALQKVFEKKA